MSFFYENTDAVDLYFMAIHSLNNTYHKGVIKQGDKLATGGLFGIFAETEQELLDLIYTDQYEVIEEYNGMPVGTSQGISGSLIPIDWSVGYGKESAQEVVDYLNVADFLIVEAIKHPDREEWAVPYQAKVLANYPENQHLPFLKIKALESVIQNNRRTQAEMLDEGWGG